ncbi:MAG: DUF2156 domain-containing protein [Deltaproteobacteria bacterium]|nr:DUF2156 domain-containing protein [Deltaproteobacteria bacterium]
MTPLPLDHVETDHRSTLEEFKPLEIEDRDVIIGYLRRDPPRISELTFTNLFMWRHYYRPVWRVVDESLVIICTPFDAPAFSLAPIGPGDKTRALEFLFDHQLETGSPTRLSRVEREFIERWIDLQRYRVEADPNQSDYVYLTEDLINLSGRHLHQKRNHLNYFLKNYSCDCLELDEGLVTQVLEMQEEWCLRRDCQGDSRLAGENEAIIEALQYFKELNFRGLAVLIDNKIEAFTLGEPLNPETVVIHAEKANPEIRGLYSFVNQYFCQYFWSGYKYINREQDLGVEGLRQAKKSYHPYYMMEKFNIFLNY